MSKMKEILKEQEDTSHEEENESLKQKTPVDVDVIIFS